MPALTDLDLFLTQDQFMSDDLKSMTVLTRFIHVESNEWVEYSFTLPTQKLDPQGGGSTNSYARRYALCTCLGLATADDDAQLAVKTAQDWKKTLTSALILPTCKKRLKRLSGNLTQLTALSSKSITISLKLKRLSESNQNVIKTLFEARKLFTKVKKNGKNTHLKTATQRLTVCLMQSCQHRLSESNQNVIKTLFEARKLFTKVKKNGKNTHLKTATQRLTVCLMQSCQH
uniref:Recombination protein n=1 Tax=Vibrio phage Vc1 TaxID=1480731 RepID=A0A6M5CDV3_9CAUD